MSYKRHMGCRGEEYRHTSVVLVIVSSLGSSLGACTDKSDAEYRADVDTALRDSIGADLVELVRSARDLQAASPNRAWNMDRREAAITDMRNAWKRMRIAYEHVEGAVTAMYPEVDAVLDARYEENLARLDANGDKYLFDGWGVVGMHAIERILFAPMIRPEVTAFERTLDGYVEAAYPVSDDDAIAFKTLLVQRTIDDADALRKRWRTATIDAALAYRGLIGVMIEDKENMRLAVASEEESRYSNVTLFDLRASLDGTQKTYELFRDWIRSKEVGAHSDSKIQVNFDRLSAAYGMTPTDSLPAIPASWCSANPSDEDLATPFGVMWQLVRESVDSQDDSSVVFLMDQIATLLGFSEPASAQPIGAGPS